jgi:cytochrome b
VWDSSIRLVHALLVGFLPFSWWSATTHHLSWHRLSGYCVLGLVLFRLLWGIVGSQTARFSTFLKGPRLVWEYARGRGAGGIGHNPLGGWSVAAMLVTIAAQVTLGLFTIDEDGLDPSPLAKFIDFGTARSIANIHHRLFYVLLGLVLLHLAAVVFYAVRGRNLVTPMITGRDRSISARAPLRMMSNRRALIVACIAAVVAWIVSRGFTI